MGEKSHRPICVQFLIKERKPNAIRYIYIVASKNALRLDKQEATDKRSWQTGSVDSPDRWSEGYRLLMLNSIRTNLAGPRLPHVPLPYVSNTYMHVLGDLDSLPLHIGRVLSKICIPALEPQEESPLSLPCCSYTLCKQLIRAFLRHRDRDRFIYIYRIRFRRECLCIESLFSFQTTVFSNFNLWNYYFSYKCLCKNNFWKGIWF